jgi:hypothetical protein
MRLSLAVSTAAIVLSLLGSTSAYKHPNTYRRHTTLAIRNETAYSLNTTTLAINATGSDDILGDCDDDDPGLEVTNSTLAAGSMSGAGNLTGNLTGNITLDGDAGSDDCSDEDDDDYGDDGDDDDEDCEDESNSTSLTSEALPTSSFPTQTSTVPVSTSIIPVSSAIAPAADLHVQAGASASSYASQSMAAQATGIVSDMQSGTGDSSLDSSDDESCAQVSALKGSPTYQ